MRRRNTSDEGFMLIELLVVIVILGVLAGVVVLAVVGLGDTSKANAEAADFTTIAKAEEAYFASTTAASKYADEASLVPAFLAEVSTLHDVCLSPNKKAYKVVKQVDPPGNSCAGVSVPNP